MAAMIGMGGTIGQNDYFGFLKGFQSCDQNNLNLMKLIWVLYNLSYNNNNNNILLHTRRAAVTRPANT